MNKVLRNNIIAVVFFAVTLILGITIGVVATNKKQIDFNVGINYDPAFEVAIKTSDGKYLFDSRNPISSSQYYISNISTDTIYFNDQLFPADVTTLTLIIENYSAVKLQVTITQPEQVVIIGAGSENSATTEEVQIVQGNLGNSLYTIKFEEKLEPFVMEVDTFNALDTMLSADYEQKLKDLVVKATEDGDPLTYGTDYKIYDSTGTTEISSTTTPTATTLKVKGVEGTDYSNYIAELQIKIYSDYAINPYPSNFTHPNNGQVINARSENEIYKYYMTMGEYGGHTLDWIILGATTGTGTASTIFDTGNSYGSDGRVMGYDSSLVLTDNTLKIGETPAKYMFVIAQYLLDTSVAFNSSYQTDGNNYFAKCTSGTSTTITYGSTASDAKTKVDSYCANTAIVNSAMKSKIVTTSIKQTTYRSGCYKTGSNYGQGGAVSQNTTGSAKFFLLGAPSSFDLNYNNESFMLSTYFTPSSNYAKAFTYSSTSTSGSYWWLRSGVYEYSILALLVDSDGSVYYGDVYDSLALRPAFVLNLAA